MKTQTDYAKMQKEHYNQSAPVMNMTGNHRHHDANPDYKSILLKRLTEEPERFKGTYALDFGCGQGRNVSNMIKWFPGIFKRADGIDISEKNIRFCNVNLQLEVVDENKFKFFVNNGLNLEALESDFYSFVMSTIVFQHICAHETRFALMKEIFRVMKSDGIFSFQMGYGDGHPNTAGYYDNVYDTSTTNGGHDVKVTDPSQIVDDLKKIGFTDITYVISNSDHDRHGQWIFIDAKKP